MSYLATCQECTWSQVRKRPDKAMFARAVHVAYEHHTVELTEV